MLHIKSPSLFLYTSHFLATSIPSICPYAYTPIRPYAYTLIRLYAHTPIRLYLLQTTPHPVTRTSCRHSTPAYLDSVGELASTCIFVSLRVRSCGPRPGYLSGLQYGPAVTPNRTGRSPKSISPHQIKGNGGLKRGQAMPTTRWM